MERIEHPFRGGTMTVEVGQPAPDFTLRDQHGQDVTLSAFRGDKIAVVLFYPFAFSGTCTNELGAIRDDLPSFVNDDVQLLAVSCDPMYSLRVYAERERLTFPLLSDFWPHGEVATAYGCFDEQLGCAVRATFVVRPDGILAWHVKNAVSEARDPADLRRVLSDLSGSGHTLRSVTNR
jgi:mycoredoxin-dependent peroxiredoxin